MAKQKGVKKNDNNSTPKKQCEGECKKVLLLNNFYNTNSKLSDGKLNICKKCVESMINHNDIETIYKILQLMDIPFFTQYWEIAKEKSPENPWGKYITMANSKINEFKNKTWKDSKFENKTPEFISSNIPNNELDNNINPSDIKKLQEKYGYGFNNEEYLNFERKYKKLSRGYKEKTELHTERLITYIIHKVKEEMSTAKGDVQEAEKWAKLAQKDATDAKLNVSQLSKSDITGGIDLLPQLVEAIEQHVSLIPLLPKVLAQPYDDADLIIWANVNYLRHLEEKPFVEYREIWNFYDKMLEENFKQKGFSEEQIQEEKLKRNNVFRDLGDIYIEPLYEHPDDFIEENGDTDEFS
jgi:hypothetical protein